jgi:hypothetical protein
VVAAPGRRRIGLNSILPPTPNGTTMFSAASFANRLASELEANGLHFMVEGHGEQWFNAHPALRPLDGHTKYVVKPHHTLKPGSALLLGVVPNEHGQCGVLCVTDVSRKHHEGYGQAEWKDGAVVALHTAHAQCLGTVRGAFSRPPERADEHWLLKCPSRLGVTSSHDYQTIDGASYGLPLFLAIASRWLNRALPADLAATGRLGSDQNIHPVDGLAAKWDALRAYAPGIRRFLVPPGGRGLLGEARTNHPDLKTIEVATLHDAIRLAELEAPASFGDTSGLNVFFAGCGADLANVERFLEKAAIVDSHAGAPWLCYEHAAHWLLDNFVAGESLRDPSLAVIAAHVVLRHGGHTRRSPAVGTGDILTRPWGLRTRLVAHLVQHSRDTGNPGLADAVELAHKQLSDTPLDTSAENITPHANVGPDEPYAIELLNACRELDTEQYKVAGALARLYSSDRKRMHVAGWLSWALARAWCDVQQPEGSSFPLACLVLVASLDIRFNTLVDDARTYLQDHGAATHTPWTNQHTLTLPDSAQAHLQLPDPGQRQDWSAILQAPDSALKWRVLRRWAIAAANEKPSSLSLLLNHPHFPLPPVPCPGRYAQLTHHLLSLHDADVSSPLDTAAIDVHLDAVAVTDFATVYFARHYCPTDHRKQVAYVLSHVVY